MKSQASKALPELLRFLNGTPVLTPESWPQRRQEMLESIVEIEYGGLPPRPSSCRVEELHTAIVKHLDNARFTTWRIVTGSDREFSFIMTTLAPSGDGPFPVVLTGDGCWRYATDEVVAKVLNHGYMFAQFNRVEIAPDINNTERVSGLYRTYPSGHYGALSAWAWGYHRCVDALISMKTVDARKIAITGHSRGGKTVLLAGATDERIALVAANNSGAGGAGCFRIQGPQSETLADCIRGFPYWYGPTFKSFIGREQELPFDQHFLKALIAPRSLLTTEASGDLWANPSGTWETHKAAAEAYAFLGAGEKLGIHFRDGGHSHSPSDWDTFLEFMDWQFKGTPPSRSFNGLRE